MDGEPRPPASAVRPPGALLGLVGLFVSDMGASVGFYRRLGVEGVPEGAERQSSFEVELENGFVLWWMTAEEARNRYPGLADPLGGPSNTLEFRLASPAAVDAKHAELTGAGYRGLREPFDAPWGARVAAVTDPDGNAVGLVACP